MTQALFPILKACIPTGTSFVLWKLFKVFKDYGEYFNSFAIVTD